MFCFDIVGFEWLIIISIFVVCEIATKFKRNILENSEKLMKLSPFFPLNFLKKAAELYNDIYKQKKFILCSKNIEN